LPPEDIEAFFQVAGLDPERTTVFRERTTRANIQYKIVIVQGKAAGAGSKGSAARKSAKAKTEADTEEAEDWKVYALVQ
jgi:hypothetical protein